MDFKKIYVNELPSGNPPVGLTPEEGRMLSTSGLQKTSINSVASQKAGSEKRIMKKIVDHRSKRDPGCAAACNPTGMLIK